MSIKCLYYGGVTELYGRGWDAVGTRLGFGWDAVRISEGTW